MTSWDNLVSEQDLVLAAKGRKETKISKKVKKADITDHIINPIVLFTIGDSIDSKVLTFTSEKNKNKPKPKKKTAAKKQKTASGVAFPGAETVGGTFPVPM